MHTRTLKAFAFSTFVLLAAVGLGCATPKASVADTDKASCPSCTKPCAKPCAKPCKKALSLLPEGHVALGSLKVWPLSDGQLQLQPALFLGVPSEEKLKLLGVETEESPLYTPLNVFLVESAERRILIDAGTGTFWGESSGQLASALQANNMALESINAVLLTHLHGDHFGGLLTEDMQSPRFPNATVWVHEAELAFWTGHAQPVPEAFAPMQEGVQRLVSVLGDKLKTFSQAKHELFPGIHAMHAPGHTPGHTLFMLASEGKKLLVTGDLIPNMRLHTVHPQAHFFFDVEPQTAATLRLQWMEKAAQKGLWLASSHAPAPGIGRLEKQTDNTFTFVPIAQP